MDPYDTEALLDEGIEETFPASDPVAVSVPRRREPESPTPDPDDATV